MEDSSTSRSGWSTTLSAWAVNIAVVLVLYVLSSGPVLGAAFWLREATHNDAFYLVLWLYFPVLFTFAHIPPVGWYIEWWVVDVFHTVGPG